MFFQKFEVSEGKDRFLVKFLISKKIDSENFLVNLSLV